MRRAVLMLDNRGGESNLRRTERKRGDLIWAKGLKERKAK